jgi:hypothetical protein
LKASTAPALAVAVEVQASINSKNTQQALNAANREKRQIEERLNILEAERTEAEVNTQLATDETEIQRAEESLIEIDKIIA